MPAKKNIQKNQAIKVAVFGMDTRSIKILSLVFQEKLKGLCEIVSDNLAEVAIFDMDGSDAEEQWANFKDTHKTLPTIVMSMLAKDIENTRYVKKPIVLPVLLNAINELASSKSPTQKSTPPPKKVDTASTGGTASNAATTLNTRMDDSADNKILKRAETGSNTGIFFKPQNYALGYLQQAITEAKAKKAALKLTCWGKRYIAFSPTNHGEILTDMNDSMLRNLAILQVGNELTIDVEPMAADSFFSLSISDETTSHRDSSFLWKLALLTARGRVPEKTDLDTPLYLQCWPNMTRLEPIPEGIRIVALWIQEPRSINDLAEALDIPLEQVMNFYSACYTIGLAGIASRKADNLVKPDQPSEHVQRGLFASILQRFSNKAA